jgi:mRNA interferase MazF
MKIPQNVVREFINWTKLKVRLHVSEKVIFTKEKEIWWACLGQNIGVEINGKNQSFERPVLVIKSYNKNATLILPISSKVSTGKFHILFTNHNGEQNIVNLSQLKVISNKRFIRKIGKMNDADYIRIKKELKETL